MFRQSYNTIIVGAGPSGLAASYQLNKIKDTVIFEASEEVAKSFHYLWDGFELAQPVKEIKMDGLDCSELDPDYHLKRDEIIHLFEKYVVTHNLQIKYNTQVKVIKKDVLGNYIIETTNGSYTAQNVILALGARMQPKYPESITEEVKKYYESKILHSASYKNLQSLSVKPHESILVVGSGLSALSIAKDLKKNKEEINVSISCAYADDLIKKKNDHLVDNIPVKLADLKEMKVKNKGKFLGIDKQGQLQFESDDKSGHIKDYAKIIFATGYYGSFEYIGKLLNDSHVINTIRKHECGVTKEPGLYVVGIPKEGQYTVTITQGNIEVKAIANHILQNRSTGNGYRFFSQQTFFPKPMPPSRQRVFHGNHRFTSTP